MDATLNWKIMDATVKVYRWALKVLVSQRGPLLESFHIPLSRWHHVRRATKILVTSGCWWIYVDDNFWMLVKEFRYWWRSFECWCPTLMLIDRGCWWRKRSKPSPTSQKYRQHISSSASVINIDVACDTSTGRMKLNEGWFLFSCWRNLIRSSFGKGLPIGIGGITTPKISSPKAWKLFSFILW